MKLHDGRKERPAVVAALMEEICRMVDRVIPQHWPRATLILNRTDESFGPSLSHRIESPDGHPESVPVPAELIEATQKLEESLVERDATFQRAIIWIVCGHTNWSIHIEYDLAASDSA